MDGFRMGVSVKAVLPHRGKFLLRVNQRREAELLGGRLEAGDASLEDRLRIEILEESGIVCEVLDKREPWVYLVGRTPVVIVPFLCRIAHIPPLLHDQDGGRLIWVDAGDIPHINMPLGYGDSIQNRTPRFSNSREEGAYPRLIPGYVEHRFAVRVTISDAEGRLIAERTMEKARCLRGLLAETLGARYDETRVHIANVARDGDVVNIGYVYR